MGLNCVGTLSQRVFSVNILEKFLEVYDNLKKHSLFSRLFDCKNTVYNIIYKICVNQLLTVKASVNGRLLV